MKLSHPRCRTLCGLVLVFAATLCGACQRKGVQTNPARNLEEFVADARRDTPPSASEGSLWVARGPQSNVYRDFKARDLNDIVTIQVFERTEASASANASNTRSSSVEAGFSNLFGIESKVSELGNLVNGTSESGFEGEGSTTRSNILTTTLTARVIEVLPNGYLVIEGVRSVRINDEDQIVRITGVIRPQDVTPSNIIASASVAQMQVSLEGKGIVSQPLQPGWLYKILSGILPF